MKNKTEFKYWWILGLLIPPLGILLYCSKLIKMSNENRTNLLTGTIIGTGIWVFIALSFLISVNGTGPSQEKEYSVADWIVETKKSEPVVTVIGMTSCGHCQAYKPVIERLAEEEGFKLYFFETDALSQEDSEIVETKYEFETFENLVPFTFIVKEGKVIAENTGFGGETEIVKFLLNNGVIK